MSQWRDSKGWSREEQVQHRTYSVNGPDGEDHSINCLFYARYGASPCSCDASRLEGSVWFQKYIAWLKAMMWSQSTAAKPFAWPVEGPDGDMWVPEVDFNTSQETRQ